VFVATGWRHYSAIAEKCQYSHGTVGSRLPLLVRENKVSLREG
jgi:hypothetical protein